MVKYICPFETQSSVDTFLGKFWSKNPPNSEIESVERNIFSLKFLENKGSLFLPASKSKGMRHCQQPTFQSFSHDKMLENQFELTPYP